MGTIRKLDENVNIIGTNLKRIREEHGLSQYDLCCKLELLGVTMFKADISKFTHLGHICGVLKHCFRLRHSVE